MTDTEVAELVRLAAVATGRKLWWNERDEKWYVVASNGCYSLWHPDSDDGDSRRLAMELTILVNPMDDCVEASGRNPNGTTIWMLVEYQGVSERCAAARLAVLKVAAEVERRIQKETQA
jgi:hypothetical protein